MSERGYSGHKYVLEAEGYLAGVTSGGARLQCLTYDGRPLIAQFTDDALPPVFRGAVLAPWPNRIADGRYVHAAKTHQLPINEPSRMTALHGLVVWHEWEAVRQSAAAVRLKTRILPREGYPFALALVLDYELTGQGLGITLAAYNEGDEAAPYGCSIHPYLVAGDGVVDNWFLQLPADGYLEVTADRLLPIGHRSVAGSAFDFRQARRIGDTRIDHAFTGLDFNLHGGCCARLIDDNGDGVEMMWDKACRWVQIHTADRPEAALDRTGLALEPMTCPPNAFVSGVDVIEVKPGEQTRVSWQLRAVRDHKPACVS